MSNYLILINNAPKMGLYHKALGEQLKMKGHNVAFAFSDELPIVNYSLNLDGFSKYIFSDFFKENYNQIFEINPKYKKINIWKTYFSDFDRSTVHYKFPVYDKKYYHTLMVNLVNFFDKIIKEEKIDFIIYENISNSFSYVAYEVGKINNVKYRGYVGSRLPNRFELHTEEFGIKEEFKNKFENINIKDIDESIKNEISNYLAKYDGNEMPTYHPKKSKLSADYSIFKRYFESEKLKLIKGILSRSIGFGGDSKYRYQIQNPLLTYFNLFKRQLIKKNRTKFGVGLFEKKTEGDNYFLFPLHMKPESSTSVLSRHFCDDIAVIKNIAFNIPFGYKLYVKEHFVNYGNLPLEFYKELKKIPNVKLISSNEDSMSLIKDCKALITLTSTMGLEALFMGKKVIVFGDVFYAAHSNCIKLDSFENLFQILLNLEESINQESLYEENQRFVAAYRSITFEGHVGYPIYENDDINRFTSAFVSALEIYDGI